MSLDKKQYLKRIHIASAILIILLIVEGFNFAFNSAKIVVDSNRDNFAYTVKIRETVEEIDKIVERAQVNMNVIVDTLNVSYDTSKLYNEKYNRAYLHQLDPLIKAALINTPGVDGAWFQINADLPFSGDTYNWYALRNGKIIDYKAVVEKNDKGNRKLNPQDDPYYFEAVGAGELVWSKIYEDVEAKTEMITISAPVYKHGVLIGVVGIDISVVSLQQALNNMQSVFGDSEVFLVDENNQIMLSQLTDKKSNVPTNMFVELFKNEKDKEQGLAEYFENGVRRTAIVLPLSNKYHIVLTFPNGVIFKGFDRLLGTMCFMFLILITLGIISLISRHKIIAANKKTENEAAKLKTIVDSSPSIVIMKDLNGVYVDCNQKFLDVMKINRKDFVGKTDYDFFSEPEIEDILKNDEIVKETKKLLVKESFYHSSEGEKFYVEKYIVPILDTDNNLTNLLIIGYDITKKEQEKELLEQAKEAAEKATMMKSSFLANMSHEIRTPMNGVFGFLQLLEDTNPTPEQKELIADAQVSSELLLNLINEILDFSKIEAGKLTIDNLNFDIRSVVEDVTIMNTSSACMKGLDVNSLICSDVPQRVYGDPSRIKQILNNLVGNALKFTQEGGVVVYVNVLSKTENDVTLTFRVKDTGIGIAQDKLEMIFESFTQADASTTRKFGGTGLGLAISQKLATLMNGRLDVESNLNEGSTFTLTVPFKIDTNQSQESNTPITSLSGTTVLVMEDSCTDSKIIRYYLNEVNCNIKQAHSFKEALGLINQVGQDISAVLIDYKIESAGELALSWLFKSHESTKDIPLILYTPLLLGDSSLIKERGFAAYLTKPLKKKELIDTIEKVTKHPNESVPEPVLGKQKFDPTTKILLVEDTEMNYIFIQKLLSKIGLTCDIVTEGQSAISAFKNKQYDLVLMDCQMPILDGYEATKGIRSLESEGSHVPIIAMTANVLTTDAQRCYEAGMDDYLSKPIRIKELLSVIGKYVKHSAISEENSEGESLIGTSSYKDGLINEMVLEVGFTEDEALELFNQFLEFLSKNVADVEAAFDKNEFEIIKQIAHKLKGASANLGIEKIVQLSTQLENETSKEEVIKQIKDYLVYLNTLYV